MGKMRNIRNLRGSLALKASMLAACAALLFLGCRNPMHPPSAGQDAATGTISLTISMGGLGRTIQPEWPGNFAGVEFRLDLLYPSSDTVAYSTSLPAVPQGQAVQVGLPTGTWDLRVSAFWGESGTKFARGVQENITVGSGPNGNTVVDLFPIHQGYGTFRWNMDFHPDVFAAYMEITRLDGNGVLVPDSRQTLELVVGGTASNPYPGGLSLAAGEYRVVFWLHNAVEDDPARKSAIRSTVLRVYNNMESFFGDQYAWFTADDLFTIELWQIILSAWNGDEWAFDDTPHGAILWMHFELAGIGGITESNFNDIPHAGIIWWLNYLTHDPWIGVPTNEDELHSLIANALEWVSDATGVTVRRDGGAALRFGSLAEALASVVDNVPHTITLFEDQWLEEWILYAKRHITLRGSGAERTVSLDGGGSLFIVGPGVTLVLDENVTLHGHCDNFAPLVRVDEDGTLLMRDGSLITGNTAHFESGGGVLVGHGGTFNMEGGEIHGNEAADGGGVFVDGGVFNMKGGTIFGNEAYTGGGVYVGEGGSFNMSGGIIVGNDPLLNDGDPNYAAVSGTAALYVEVGATALYGSFANGTPGASFTPTGALGTEDRTIEVVNGVLIRPRPETPDIEMVPISGGTFQMGSLEGTPNSDPNERPVRYVTLSGFYMSRFEVTQGEWYDVMFHLPGTGVGTRRPSFFNGTINNDGDMVSPTFEWRNLPVERVSWYDAIVFSNRLSIQRGLTPAYSIGGSTNPDAWGPVPTIGNATWDAVEIVPGSTGYRLPTEAQWEFAARGGIVCHGNYAFSGSNTATDVAWTWENSGNRTHEVGTRQYNALGLHDMSGNVWEWVWDWFGAYPDYPETDPLGASLGSDRVIRGASWTNSGSGVRLARRYSFNPATRSHIIGFRLVRPDPLAPPASVSVSRDGAPVQRFANLAAALASVTDTAPHTITLYENQQLTTWGPHANRNITLQGWNNESVMISHIGAVDIPMFNIQSASLTLGNNITLRGRPGGTEPSIFVGVSGTLTMLEGSLISGHTTVGNISPVLINGENARLYIQGGEITGNNNRYGRFFAAVNLTNGVLTMSGGSITGNYSYTNDAPGEWADVAIGASAAVTATLSGTAEIGVIRLSPSAAPDDTRIAIGPDWTGNIGRLDLAHNAANPALVAGHWDGRIVLSGSGGHPLTEGDVSRVALGYFVSTLALAPPPQPITDHEIGVLGTNLGRLIRWPPNIAMVRIQGGTFLMGSPEDTPNSRDDERPVRQVTLSGFYMSQFEVTQGQWYDLMGTRPSGFTGATNSVGNPVTGVNWRNLPVESVSWYDAEATKCPWSA